MESAKRILGDLDSPDCSTLPTPCGITRAEKFRDEFDLRSEYWVPCDAMVFGKGTPDHPAATKIGGQPFWPVHRDWPEGPQGNPLYFLAQINFSDSRDIVSVPAPLLFILSVSDKEPEWFCSDLTFVWCDPTLESCKFVRVPTMCKREYFACLHRTYDYLDDPQIGYESDPNGYDKAEAKILHGPKIGGCPAFIQGEFEYGGFLCQLGDVGTFGDTPFPWANMPTPIDDHYEEAFSVCDGGLCYIFQEDDGTVRWSMVSH